MSRSYRHVPGGGSDTDSDNGLDFYYDRAASAAAGATTDAPTTVASISTLAGYLTDGYWSFAGTVAHHWASPTVSVNITALTTAEQTLATNALELWHEVANISFTFITGAANITYNHAGTQTASTGGSWNGAGNMTSATVDISSDWISTDGGFADGRTGTYSYGFETYIHETGHALGLGHQGPYNGGFLDDPYNTSSLYANDTWQYSVMSYNRQHNFGGATDDYVISPQMADIFAVQSIYGAGTAHTGNTVYGFHSNAGPVYDFSQYSGIPAFTIYDSGGTDTLDFSGFSQNQTINLTGGTWSSVGGYVNNIGIYTTSVIENAIGGSGNDTIIGNSADNVLKGGGGNDTIDGGGGTDSAVFSGVMTLYTITPLGGTSVQVSGPDGTDTLTNVERLVFDDQTVVWPPPVITVPTPGDDVLIGTSGDDTINALAGNDTITGGLGNDTIDGGPGDDTAIFSGNLSSYTLHDLGTKITVSGPDGNDTLFNVEHLKFDDGTINAADGSALFDTVYYDRTYLDVFHAGVDAHSHYNTNGWHEGRDPNAFFSTSFYLATNPDVKASGVNPLDQYDQSGWKLGRDPSPNFDTRLYLVHNPDVAAAGIDPLAHYLQFGIAEGRQTYAAIGTAVHGFDAEYYLIHNPDVAAAGVDPFQHYEAIGWKEGRNPNAWFDTKGYLSHYTDVAAGGINPLDHYEQYGWKEGRDPSAAFDTLKYLAAYPDIAAAHVNPLDHYINSGIYEGRSTFGDGLFH
jgi:Ca2+-binding RTX toxin-like protein